MRLIANLYAPHLEKKTLDKSYSTKRQSMGPTAAAKSVAKIDHLMASDGTSFHFKLHSSMAENEEGTKALVSFARGFFDLVSAFFTQLDRKIQDDIMAKTEHDGWR